MIKTEAKQLIHETYNWFPEDSTGRLILKSFKLEEYNSDAYAAPVPFSKLTESDEWKLAKDNAAVTARIRYVQEAMDTKQFPLRSSVYIMHEKGFCFLILGTNQVAVIRERRSQGGLQRVTLDFNATDKSDELPRFGKGELVSMSASSPVKGWLYLFSVDANRVVTPIYPGEGRLSDINLSQNSRISISDAANEAMRREALHQSKPHIPLCYCGDTVGFERFVAMVIHADNPVPVTISHLRSCFPLPFLFAHEIIHRGAGYSPTDSCNDFASLSLDQIAIGTLDYYYEG